jgi:hypothetical protein
MRHAICSSAILLFLLIACGESSFQAGTSSGAAFEAPTHTAAPDVLTKTAAPDVYNERRHGFGTTADSADTFYPASISVEYYVPGSDKYSGMDWKNLLLIYQQEGEQWYLVGVTRGMWTI